MQLLKRLAFIAVVLIAVALLAVLLQVLWILVFPPPGAVSIGISEAFVETVLVETVVVLASAFAVWRMWRFMRRHSHASNRSS